MKKIALFAVIFLLGSFTALKLERSPITKDIVIAAKELVAMNFSDAQADSMLVNLNNYRVSYEVLRKFDMPNSAVPALSFNPVTSDFVFPDKISSCKVNRLVGIQLPANRDDLAFYSIAELAELIRIRKISLDYDYILYF